MLPVEAWVARILALREMANVVVAAPRDRAALTKDFWRGLRCVELDDRRGEGPGATLFREQALGIGCRALALIWGPLLRIGFL